jgi:phospholipid transport system substrate-binding protein
MPTTFLRAAAIALAATPLLPALPLVPVPTAAAQTTAANPKEAAAFIDGLAKSAFSVLRDKSMGRAEVKAKFRQMLRSSFAVESIGNRLIRRYRRTITPAQYQAYMEAFPDYVIDTYADRLFEYSNSDLKVIRAIPRGSSGAADVFTRVTLPGGTAPIDAIWSVNRQANGQYQVTNLTISGVNLSLTQEADFTSYIERNGFDALIQFMKRSGGKA